jgi:hypothetical protein
LRWKRSLESLAALMEWLQAFVLARDYVMTALPLGREAVDRIRESLLQSIDESHGFPEDRAHQEFDGNFPE